MGAFPLSLNQEVVIQWRLRRQTTLWLRRVIDRADPARAGPFSTIASFNSGSRVGTNQITGDSVRYGLPWNKE